MARSSSSPLSAYEIELIDRVHSHFQNNDPRRFVFFYTDKSPFSNFYPSKVEEDGIQFHCTEQYMMYHKARLFHDDEIAQQILKAEKPARCKSLGRKVSDFNEQIWRDNRTRIVSQGNYLKFTQNEHLKPLLRAHEGALFVEAAANDRVWGVGLREDDPLIQRRANWKGLNLMGYLLNDIANRLREEDRQ